ncbi:unnamed protein product [Ceratitis capitata]|uniref:(Mediterranean fruit fly) hypothetical protein n=1 Tax=Ceratitis capitata TaxID=7213 RepID=A0A811V7W2_CERCA|nr:unnamed protein product [Ceratitis capitata]
MRSQPSNEQSQTAHGVCHKQQKWSLTKAERVAVRPLKLCGYKSKHQQHPPNGAVSHLLTFRSRRLTSAVRSQRKAIKC